MTDKRYAAWFPIGGALLSTLNQSRGTAQAKRLDDGSATRHRHCAEAGCIRRSIICVLFERQRRGVDAISLTGGLRAVREGMP